MKKVWMGIYSLALSGILVSCGTTGGDSVDGKASGSVSKDFRVVVTGEMSPFARVADMDVASYGINVDQMFLSADGNKLYVFGGTEETKFNKKLLEYDLREGVPTKASHGYAIATENRQMKKLVSTADGKVGFFIGEHNVNIIDLEKFQTMNTLNLTNKYFGDLYYMDGVLSTDKKYFYLVETNTNEDFSIVRKFDVSELMKEKDRSFSIKEVASFRTTTRVGHIDIAKDGKSLYMILDGERGSDIDAYFTILDVSEKTQMNQLGSFSSEETFLNMSISKKDDNLVYISSIGDDFIVCDVQDRANPKIVNHLDFRSYCDDLSLSKDGNILVCDTTIFDISDISHPSILRNYVSTGSDEQEYTTKNLVADTNQPNGYVYSSGSGELRRFSYSELYDKDYVSKIAKNSLENHLELSFVVSRPKGETIRYTVNTDTQSVVKVNGDTKPQYEGHAYFSDADIVEEETSVELLSNATGIVHFDVNVKDNGKTYEAKATLEIY